MSDMNLPGSWSLDVKGDLSAIVSHDGEHIATTYGKDARLIVEGHNRVLADMNTGAAAPQDERERFEAWRTSIKDSIAPRHPDYAWEAWQGRAALPAQAVDRSNRTTPGGIVISDDPLSAIQCCINDYDNESNAAVNNAILAGLRKAKALIEAAPVQDVAPIDFEAAWQAADESKTYDENKGVARYWFQQGRAIAKDVAPRDARNAWHLPVSELLGHLSDVLSDDTWRLIDTQRWNAVSALVGAAQPAAQPADAQPVAYWAAVNKEGDIEYSCNADDANDGDFARDLCNQHINGRLNNGGDLLRLKALYAAPQTSAQAATIPTEGL